MDCATPSRSKVVPIPVRETRSLRARAHTRPGLANTLRGLRTLLGVSVLSLAVFGCFSEPSNPVDPGALWEEAMPFSQFLAEAEARREMWVGNYQMSNAVAEIVGEAREIPGDWRLLVVAEDRCSDSANTVPHIARLADDLENLDVRIVRSGPGRGIMATHLTPDGRTATPTMVLLNGDGREVGCLVEQPPELQAWWLGEARDIADEAERMTRKFAWYDEDAGASTQAAIVELMEAASRGEVICRAGGRAD